MSERSDGGPNSCTLVAGLGQGFRHFPHRFSFQIELVSLMDESVQDGVGQRPIPDHLMPGRDRQLARDDRRAAVVAIFQDFEEIPAAGIVQGRQAPKASVVSQ